MSEKAREIAQKLSVISIDFDEACSIIEAALAAERVKALEEAAKVADARNLSIMSMTTADVTAMEIAAAIRALKDKP